MKRLNHWQQVAARVGHTALVRLLGLVDAPHGWDGDAQCEACGCTLTYVAEGWDRWRECTNTCCELASPDDWFDDHLDTLVDAGAS